MAAKPATGIITEWAAQPDISARSVLVTIFGDTVLPVTSSFLLAQLFELTNVFGFSERLVRTSMFRLSAEDWFTSEREGRQSRYSATELAIAESRQASERIYGIDSPVTNQWDNQPWTLALLDPTLSAGECELAATHLNRNGFFRLGADLFGSPTTSPEDLHAEPGTVRATMVAKFEDLDSLLADGFFTSGYDTETAELAYKSIVARYQPLAAQHHRFTDGSITGLEAFALRTMLVHDLRRIKLRFPELPASLHPPDWAGQTAHQLAADLYPALSQCAAPTLSDLLQVDYPSGFAERFVR